MATTGMRQLEPLSAGLLVRAPAKLNLSLLIAGKRPDGFHEIETVVAKVDWYDELRIQPGQENGIEFSCEGPCWAPPDESNLVYRAAEQVLGTCREAHQVRLTLVKNIPAGSGLGSGSSDAAATLVGLNAYLNLGLSRLQLAEAAARLGSDVAFFLHGPLALCTGRGEHVAELPGAFDFTALLILPEVNVSTREVYANYIHDPALYHSLRTRIDVLIERGRVDLVAKMCANMLETSCFELFRELSEVKEAVESLGVGPVCLSGSGSTMFCILGDEDIGRVESLRDEIAAKTGCRSVVVRNNRW